MFELITQTDLKIIENLEILRRPLFDKLMIIITYLGNWQVILLGLIICSLIFILYNKWNYLKILLISVLGGQIIVEVMKHIIRRSRPVLNPLIEETGFSFPSGHAFAAVYFYGLLTYLLVKELKNGLHRIIVVVIGLIIILGIGFSRIYLGVHWVSDVITSYILGLIWLAIVIFAFNKINKSNLKGN